MIAKLTKGPECWDQVLNEVEFAVNNTVNRSTGQTPSKLLFGMNQVGNVKDHLKYFLSSINKDKSDINELRHNACDKIEKSQEYVMTPNIDVTRGVNKKLLPKFKGPYIIKKILPNDRYLISNVEGFQVTQKPFEGVFDADHLRLWMKSSH
ncbi:uncharacterized protein LOC126882612 [Diabrotica virgifera virgifera]|uniref:Uncharacterized protein n=1 Tax=Diabrotica virgifera virgifera TaxID=50390 RepID=A0ABM5K028_DIAVI|nr:uncharacterized protein LOC126882612 [Diabrotica virgifera virgifera]